MVTGFFHRESGQVFQPEALKECKLYEVIDVEEVNEENIKAWTWNPQYLIPPMLKLIQNQKNEIEELTKKFESQQKEIDELKEIIKKLI